MRRLICLLFIIDLLAIFGFVRPLRLASHYPTEDGYPRAIFDFLGHTPGATLRYALLASTIMLLFVTAFRLADTMSGRRVAMVVFGGAALLSLSFLLLYPATNNDLFHYAMEARTLWVHHANPLVVPPEAFFNDPFLQTTTWTNLPSPYGPVWVILSGLPLLLGHGDQIWTFIAFKLMAIAFYFVATVIIYRLVRERRPGHEAGAALLFAWNPLILLYVAGNGANDVIMMAITLLAMYFAMHNRWRVAFPVLAIAVLVKFICAVFIPAFVLYAALTVPRDRWRPLIESLGLSCVLGVLLYAPFLHGVDTFRTLRYQSSQFTDSLPALLHAVLQHISYSRASGYVTHNWLYFHADVLTKAVAWTTFVIAYVLILYRLVLKHRLPHTDDLPDAAFAVMFAFLLFVMLWFQPWYLIWLISIGAITVGVRLRLTLLFSLTGLLTHAATGYAGVREWYTWDGAFLFADPLREVTLVVGTVFAVPLLYVALILYSRTDSGKVAVMRLQQLRHSTRQRLAHRNPGPAVET